MDEKIKKKKISKIWFVKTKNKEFWTDSSIHFNEMYTNLQNLIFEKFYTLTHFL